MTVWRAYAAVGAGSALGASLRYQVALTLMTSHHAFPWATLLVNVLGSWLIGAFAGFASRSERGRVARWQPFLMAGLCGGFTTFSLFGLETWQLLSLGRPWLALGYVTLSLALWLCGVWLGQRAGQHAATRWG
ncbi:fluoride efflux transporter FluC [Halomonas urumqiensis]|uniref:Fluoride-specific ion channel FluC n=1 Tax=Halomonas urumqiensis TaxID=1684789 RepID=A0A2N7UP07_9GAMM|nr:CrcB family protein [Halomonas urumqiensis]PMR82151.1 chromosome condensation protein CrcB [Halomonas urumqiensis]PTB02518.1 CrcB family protein [Halomonas urumqiensis]GHE20990.1 putative fluoride ion transporter CrcB 1 [Halomonas urumqiensis]